MKHDEAVLEMTEHMRALESTMKDKFSEQENALKRCNTSAGCANEREALQRKLHEQEEAFEAKLKEQEENLYGGQVCGLVVCDLGVRSHSDSVTASGPSAEPPCGPRSRP